MKLNNHDVQHVILRTLDTLSHLLHKNNSVMCKTLLFLFIDEEIKTRVMMYFATGHLVSQWIAGPWTYSVISKICVFITKLNIQVLVLTNSLRVFLKL